MRLTPDRDNGRVMGLVVGGLLGIAAVITTLMLAACDIVRDDTDSEVAAMASKATRRLIEVRFSAGSELPLQTMGAPGRLAGLSVGFDDTQSSTNTFSLYRVRDGKSSLVFSTAFVNSLYVDFGDLVWLQSYDVLAFTNSVTNAATAAFSME